jgi:hypothetical protein
MSTVAGFGSAHLGRADIRPDGSFVTTEWLVLGHLPVIPLRSFKLATLDGSRAFGFPSRLSPCRLVSELPLQWSQVVRTYCFFGFTATWIGIWVFVLFDSLEWDHGQILYLSIPLGVALLCVPAILPSVVRRLSYQSKHGPDKSLQPTPIPPREIGKST